MPANKTKASILQIPEEPNGNFFFITNEEVLSEIKNLKNNELYRPSTIPI